VAPGGTWTYNAPYSDGAFQGEFSMSGAPGNNLGLLAVLPLFRPTNLTYYPDANGGLGSGSLIDVSAESSLVSATDSGGNHVDVQPITADSPADNNGLVINLPSDAGEVTLEGEHPGLEVRGAASHMFAESEGSDELVTFSTDEQAGAIEGDEAEMALAVARDHRVVKSTGAGALEFSPEGYVQTGNDSEEVQLQLEFAHDGGVITTTLFDGAAVPGGSIRFSAADLAAAEAAALPSPSGPSSPTPPSLSTGASTSTGARHGSLGLIARRVRATGKGRLTLRVSCSSEGPCAGRLVVTAKSKKRGGRTQGATKNVILGSSGYNVVAAADAAVVVKLGKKALAMLESKSQTKGAIKVEPMAGAATMVPLLLLPPRSKQ
jgi:hypothetical protein